ncbi:MAG TPA: pyridoxamine 5'-phosphate oxidase family protein, partial [Bacteroidales bacterium]|nr:pyridoxamine 5'-phosphate oxidase family protein [Bacteroidales bacterium]
MPRTIAYTDIKRINYIINKCEVCYVGMIDTQGNPYVLPFNFGYENGLIYLHSGPEGKKIDSLRKNPCVCIVFSTDYVLRYTSENVACSYGMKFKSVLAYGKVEFVDNYDDKIRILNVIMKKYTNKEFSYNAPAVRNVVI